MKTIFSPRKQHYLKRVSFFLIVVALVAAMVSCNGGVTEYKLTMAAVPVEGGTATDLTNTSPYARATVVDIKAVPDPCYRFVDWSTTAGTLNSTTAATTTFTMPAEAVTVTANFEPIPPDHFKFYAVGEGGSYIGKDVQLVDQFGAFNATVGYPLSFGNAVEKEHPGMPLTPITDPNRHYTLYELDYGEGEPMLGSWQVTINNQFQDDVELTVQGPYYLAVPTQKEDHEAPACLDHLLLYEVIPSSSYLEEPIAVIGLHDQFLDEPAVQVWDPAYFATPVQKTVGSEVTEIETDQHYVYYWIEAASIEKTVQVDNQFGEQTLGLVYPELLAVPSQKIAWEQPLDHFKGYWAEWTEGPPPGFPVEVQLEDQFVTMNATVHTPYLFANPVNKGLGEGEGWTPISNWNNHLTLYWIEPHQAPQMWEVTVTNQFGIDQLLLVEGPFWLAVPTTKADHGEPVGLDHFLVYEVLDYDYQYGNLQVFLHDQFIERPASVYEPFLFTIPVQKTDASGTTDIGDEHLVFYGITGGDFVEEWLPVDNQFGPQALYVYEGYECECDWYGYDILGVPSDKTDWEPYEPT